jgi:hypothetical protein
MEYRSAIVAFIQLLIILSRKILSSKSCTPANIHNHYLFYWGYNCGGMDISRSRIQCGIIHPLKQDNKIIRGFWGNRSGRSQCRPCLPDVGNRNEFVSSSMRIVIDISTWIIEAKLYIIVLSHSRALVTIDIIVASSYILTSFAYQSFVLFISDMHKLKNLSLVI